MERGELRDHHRNEVIVVMPSRLMVELCAAAAILLLGTILWIHHNGVEQKIGEHNIEQADKQGADRQKKLDDELLKRANDAHAVEIAGLHRLYSGGGEFSSVRYTLPPRSVPKAVLPMGECPTGGVVQADEGLYRDRVRALDMLAYAGDKLAADCRELNSATHPVAASQ